MAKKEAITRYGLIIRELRKRACSFPELERALDRESDLQGSDFKISKRTFQRDLKDIREIYQIDIQYNTVERAYFIAFDEPPTVHERILEAFDTLNALHISDRLSRHIFFEQRKPLGTEHLYDLLHACRRQYIVEFTYHKFEDDGRSRRKVHPYALQEFKNRWYLLANDVKDAQIKHFALDRISLLNLTTTRYRSNPQFNIHEHFQFCFGIMKPEPSEAPVEIVLSFAPVQGKYIKSMPLHKSQEILKDNKNGLVVRLKLFLTFDLVMELRSYGDMVKVLQPKRLQEMLLESSSRVLDLYSAN
jgi:predicted DNA-binding transcriptional regulator YafY